MTALLRAALFAALAAASIPVVAVGQDMSPASLLRRIELLERANTDLERRVRELESLIKREPFESQVFPASTKWQDLANWRRLRKGMKMDEVRALLGEPATVDANPFQTTRYWGSLGGPTVQFGSNGKLEAWSEPRQ